MVTNRIDKAPALLVDSWETNYGLWDMLWRKGEPQTCLRHALSTQGSLALHEGNILKSYYQSNDNNNNNKKTCQSMKMF